MSEKHNEYESAEMVVIGAAGDIVLGIKDFPSIDDVLGMPLFYRTDDWFPCDCE